MFPVLAHSRLFRGYLRSHDMSYFSSHRNMLVASGTSCVVVYSIAGYISACAVALVRCLTQGYGYGHLLLTCRYRSRAYLAGTLRYGVCRM